jgi:hypothetical protein
VLLRTVKRRRRKTGRRRPAGNRAKGGDGGPGGLYADPEKCPADRVCLVSLALKGFILKIQGGRIKAIHTGECQWTGMVRCEDLILAEEKGASFPLPGVIDLGGGGDSDLLRRMSMEAFLCVSAREKAGFYRLRRVVALF